MSFSMLWYVGSCLAMYKLGRFTAKNPGRVYELGKEFWIWMNK
jgi:hypothetical protein